MARRSPAITAMLLALFYSSVYSVQVTPAAVEASADVAGEASERHCVYMLKIVT